MPGVKGQRWPEEKLRPPKKKINTSIGMDVFGFLKKDAEKKNKTISSVVRDILEGFYKIGKNND